ncbi:alpha/beta hydrolase [Planotetraspora kaengkrachanensis]|uniref:alpha/beta hydrolase n=1 Tax=Planotetraspora kaengkrachanensis TaxID=575193 RepID=UPI001945645B|nr:alpha/beta hydrolase [Planotetraspora kaengkrachanensis]
MYSFDGADEMPGSSSVVAVNRPTALAELTAGPVEYRLERRDGPAVVVFHGGHMRAGLAIGEDVFADLGYSVLVPSRPGYGRTPLRTATSMSSFADLTHELCRHLGIDQVAAVVGISAGGRSAVTMAARHPELVRRLILESAVSFLPWPDRRTRIGAGVIFTAATERMTWGLVRTLMRATPSTGLRLLLRDLSTRPVSQVLAALHTADRTALIALFSHMRSGRGFLNDLLDTPDLSSHVTQPALVIASRNDGAVPLCSRRIPARQPHRRRTRREPGLEPFHLVLRRLPLDH